jgi:hypothetical protein
VDDSVDNNRMLDVDIRNNNTDSFDKQVAINEISLQDDENNEQDKLSNNKNHVESSYEHIQRSRVHQSASTSLDIEKENKNHMNAILSVNLLQQIIETIMRICCIIS